MMIVTPPSQFVKTAIATVNNVSWPSGLKRVFLKVHEAQTRTSGFVLNVYNDDYVIYDGFSNEANELVARYSTTGKLGLVQSYLTMHSFSLSAANNATDYVMSGHQVYSVNRIRDIQNARFYEYPNFRFTKITNDSKYNFVDFKNSLTAWIKNRTGTPRPLTCSVRLFISWCMWGARKQKPQIGQITSEPDGFITEGGPDGGTYEGTYTKMADTFTDDAGNNFGPVYQINNLGYVTNGVPTILFNTSIGMWQVGSFDSYGDSGVVWYNFPPYVQGTNQNLTQSADIMPALYWSFSAIRITSTEDYYKPRKYHGCYGWKGPLQAVNGLGLGYLHSLYVYV